MGKSKCWYCIFFPFFPFAFFFPFLPPFLLSLLFFAFHSFLFFFFIPVIFFLSVLLFFFFPCLRSTTREINVIVVRSLNVVWWLSGKGSGFVIARLLVRLPAGSPPRNNPVDWIFELPHLRDVLMDAQLTGISLHCEGTLTG